MPLTMATTTVTHNDRSCGLLDFLMNAEGDPKRAHQIGILAISRRPRIAISLDGEVRARLVARSCGMRTLCRIRLYRPLTAAQQPHPILGG